MKIWPLIKKSSRVDVDYHAGRDINADLELLLKECERNLKSVDKKLITTAFHWCVNAHKNKIRKSGEPHYTHPLAVARIVVNEIPLDDISVASALLHDIIDGSNQYTIKDIRSEFGSTIAEIVNGLTKIQNIESHDITHLENYRKLLLSLFKDVRIILIKLADRLHNMRTMEFLEPEKQKRVAEETIEIYDPFANRFGLGRIKWEIEDLAFKYFNRKEYEEISDALQLTRREREDYIKNFTSPIAERLQSDELLKKNNIKFEIDGRAKHIFSIYNKMIAREKNIDELYDLFAIRIILDTEDSNYCFLAYGLVSAIYKPVPGTFKNYISNPKPNGYQSLHTAFIGPDNKMVEVQIRTRSMHEIAEKGVAAHFKYKRGLLPAQTVLEDKNFEEWMDLVRKIFENVGDEPPEQLLESVKRNLYFDEIYVFTPSNEMKILPKDATPLDFAYAIHTNVGDHCIGAKIYGKVVPLDYKLKTGDQVEILTSKNQKPSKDWLKIVTTHRAQSYIHKYLKEEKKNQIKYGRALWEEKIIEMEINMEDDELENFATSLNFNSRDEFFLMLAQNQIDNNVLHEMILQKKNIGLTSGEYARQYKAAYLTGSAVINPYEKLKLKSETGVKEPSIPVKYSTCCYPLPGDEIIGIIVPGRELNIHRKNCNKVTGHIETKETSAFEIEWTNLPEKEFESKIYIMGEERSDMPGEITSLILSLSDTTIKGFKFDTVDSGFTGYITLGIRNLSSLDRIFERLRSISGIKNVERYIEQ